jgi:threonine synthase
LGRAPDFQFMPVGNAGNISAYWMGYKQYMDLKKSTTKPRLMGYQAVGAAPLVNGAPVKNPETVATAIRIGNPASWKKAEQARDESGGIIAAVSDEEILQAYQLIASLEGVFCEPACGAGVAGLKKYAAQYPDQFPKNTVVVCIITGHGLKDPERAISMLPRPAIVRPDKNAILQHMRL